jgi:oligopeptidase B
MGYGWYQDGKLLNKRHTFTDFIDVAQHLVNQGYTTPQQLAAQGRSAGGLLMGAIANMRPDLFAVVSAGVPFVDVVTTMLDASIPLTALEWDEWGNPADAVDYAYMKSYSPYDNVVAQDYPHLFVFTGLNDPRVGYFEPAKWVARLRVTKTDGNALVFKIHMGSGHFGTSGRLGHLRDRAEEYAFLMDKLGV